jgi:hypothetical protein
MSWDVTLNYPGHLTDIVGQIVGPNVHSEYYVITDVAPGETGADQPPMTVAHLELVGKNDMASRTTAEAQQMFSTTRAKAILQEQGIDIREIQLPPAFRQPVAPMTMEMSA